MSSPWGPSCPRLPPLRRRRRRLLLPPPSSLLLLLLVAVAAALVVAAPLAVAVLAVALTAVAVATLPLVASLPLVALDRRCADRRCAGHLGSAVRSRRAPMVPSHQPNRWTSYPLRRSAWCRSRRPACGVRSPSPQAALRRGRARHPHHRQRWHRQRLGIGSAGISSAGSVGGGFRRRHVGTVCGVLVRRARFAESACAVGDLDRRCGLRGRGRRRLRGRCFGCWCLVGPIVLGSAGRVDDLVDEVGLLQLRHALHPERLGDLQELFFVLAFQRGLFECLCGHRVPLFRHRWRFGDEM